MKQVLMQAMFHNDLGMCVFHPWVSAFDASTPFGLQTPHMDYNPKIASRIHAISSFGGCKS